LTKIGEDIKAAPLLSVLLDENQADCFLGREHHLWMCAGESCLSERTDSSMYTFPRKKKEKGVQGEK